MHLRRQYVAVVIIGFIIISTFQTYFTMLDTGNNFAHATVKFMSSQQTGMICNETTAIARQVYEQAMHNESESKLWTQQTQDPMMFLDCEQLIRSIQMKSKFSYEMSPTLSLLRLVRKLHKLESNKNPFKIVVIGGSMTTGFVDVDKTNLRELAWPHKVLNFMQKRWPNASVEVVNLAMGGANEDTWLGNMDMIMAEAPMDVILVESAVNDQCDYDEQTSAAYRVNATSHQLLNTLMNFSSEPAVFSVELFRTAYTNNRDATKHCPRHVKVQLDPSMNKQCYYCDQWWMPQDWRASAREINSVPYISYRDAVWPDQNHPPANLCQVWSGLSHPQSGVHVMVACTVLFQFILAEYQKEVLLKTMHGLEQSIKIEVPIANENMCLTPMSSYHAIQGDSRDPMNLHTTSNGKSCWEFRADSKEKFGWICEVNRNDALREGDFYLLQKNIHIGEQRLVIISRLVSYDDRMAAAQIWFSFPNSKDSLNMFVGDPSWNVTSTHFKKTSIPQPYSIHLKGFELKNSSDVQWQANLEVTLNIRLLKGTSGSSKRNEVESSGIDKFKLVGVVSC